MRLFFFDETVLFCSSFYPVFQKPLKRFFFFFKYECFQICPRIGLNCSVYNIVIFVFRRRVLFLFDSHIAKEKMFIGMTEF